MDHACRNGGHLGLGRWASPGPRGVPQAVISMVSGELHVTNSRDGQAIFQAQGLAPGESVTGTVQLSNTGDLTGDLGFQQLDVQDQPGANGGRLSDAVHLDVEDVTGGSLVPVFAGQLGASRTARSATSRPARRAPIASRRRCRTAAPRPARRVATTPTPARP